jgi:hypothetical protein
LSKSLKEDDHLGNEYLDVRIILKWIVRKKIEVVDLIYLYVTIVVGFCKHEAEPSGFVKCGEFF